ncbi:Methyltransferase domain-containing protein [Actinacidiphila yanglinensis]|uniref:Methyltransferase domain-containing protein n=1 Tax=Actinacidiphila yanglinensis TaxID=310779 RepID=A0A1H5VKA2_9ACTN|nr:class I SAM-dependent methyltransferase [Actinacidiphila yanglinensis]SEF87248.1 Methyltransferase domain-containing protein [Actinacidiphila yanglinensis]
MSPILNSAMAKRLLRPATTLVDQRVQRPVSRLRKELDSLRKEVKELESLRSQEYAVGLLFDRNGRSGPRLPTAGQIDKLVSEVAAVSGEDAKIARRNVTIAFRNVIALEALAVGRLAGSTQNVCGKLATVPLLKPPNPEVLEIGTLYGLFSATMLRMLHRAGIEPELTIVDPLVGTQLQPGGLEGLDPTGTPVRLDVVRANLALGGKAGERARVQVGFSGDPEVRAAVSDRKYGVIVIDGDHSAQGVTEDLEWAETIAAPGAIVVLDDYGDNKWAGVQKGADEYLAGSTRFELLGRVSTSAFLRAA